MSIMQETQTDQVLPARDNGRAVARPGQIVLVFQSGGALGAYQAGVYQALHQAGIEPDWVIGTSIGAINASIIAGNRVQDRLAKLQEFWQRFAHTCQALEKAPWESEFDPIEGVVLHEPVLAPSPVARRRTA